MIDLSTLGAIELRHDGIDLRSVLSQPKRLALLVYLRVADGFVARDRLLALFWPESDDERARNALRQSLHFLRRSLGPDAVVGRAEQEVGIDADRVACDVVAFERALAEDRLEDALGLYRGEFLPGFHVDDTPELERWIDEKRRELARRAVEAALALSEREEERGEPAAAAVWARRLVALDPLSEAAVRRLMRLLARTGERARALEAFDELARRLGEELELTPSPETADLAGSIRAGDRPVPPSPTDLAAAGAPHPVGAAVPPPSRPPDPATVAEPPAAGPPVGRVTPDRTVPPDGHTPVDGPTPPGSRGARRSRASAVAAAVAVGVLLVLASRVAPRPGAPPDPAPTATPAIAVMPFLDMSEDGRREYFSHGVAEELLNVLARVPGLRVAARTSSFAFEGSGATADSIGRALGVTHLLEGSVRTDGDRMRVTVQLIETRGGYHLWSETYDRSLEEVFALQDEISREVVDRLRLELLPAGARADVRTVDPGAHELYLRGRHAWNRRTAASLRSAIAYFEEAVARDPAYAHAWAALAEAFVVLPQYTGAGRDPWHRRAEAAATRALELDPYLAEPHAALGLLRTYDRASDAEEHYTEALRLNPNYATAHHWYSIYFAERGRYEDQLREILAARSLDPLSPIIQVNVGKAFLHLRRYDEAVAAYHELVDMEPGFGFGHTVLAEALSAAGRHEEAAAAARRGLEILGEDAHVEALATAAYALARAGEHDRARQIARTLERSAATPGLRPGAWGPAQVYAGLGDTDVALRWIERAVAGDHWGGRTDLPFYDPLRDDPRFRELDRRFRQRDLGPAEPRERGAE